DRFDRQERVRLFYVACTRAADYLLLSSSVKDLARPTGDWLKLLGRRFDLCSGEFLADLPAGYATPQVRVTRAKPPASASRETRRRVSINEVVQETRRQAQETSSAAPSLADPLPADLRGIRRFSFSRLTGALDALATGDDDHAERGRPRSVPNHQVEHSVDPKELGDLVHAVLEQTEFRPNPDLPRLCDDLAVEHVTERQRDAAIEATEMVERFLTSPRASQLRNARTVYRELEFILPWPVDVNTSERYLQGFIDCLYEDQEGNWRVLDYKTNRVDDADSAAERAAVPYELQLFVYAEACEQALGVRPTESVLHFLRTGREHRFAWSKTAARSAADRLSEAIGLAGGSLRREATPHR
ncbi:MAG: PD-(D/E)XK nuclease family protein, partial [Planctomycetota bacterium]